MAKIPFDTFIVQYDPEERIIIPSVTGPSLTAS